jgi:hypothetical protein
VVCEERAAVDGRLVRIFDAGARGEQRHAGRVCVQQVYGAQGRPDAEALGVSPATAAARVENRDTDACWQARDERPQLREGERLAAREELLAVGVPRVVEYEQPVAAGLGGSAGRAAERRDDLSRAGLEQRDDVVFGETPGARQRVSHELCVAERKPQRLTTGRGCVGADQHGDRARRSRAGVFGHDEAEQGEQQRRPAR